MQQNENTTNATIHATGDRRASYESYQLDYHTMVHKLFNTQTIAATSTIASTTMNDDWRNHENV